MKCPTIEEVIEELVQDFIHDIDDYIVRRGSPPQMIMTASGVKDLRMSMMHCYGKGLDDAKRRRYR